MANDMKLKPSEFGRLRGLKGLDLPKLRVTKRSKGSSAPADRETAYNVDSVEKLINALEERERSLKSGR